MIYAYDFMPYFAPVKGNPHINDLFWVIYDRLANGCVLVVLGRQSLGGVALTQEEFPAVKYICAC